MRRGKFSLSAAVLAATAGAALANPLRMEFCVDSLGGGLYQYTFTLRVDNHDGSWAPGQGWGWITYGDASGQTSPLRNFIGDPASLPIGPFTDYSSSSGGHNGPTLGPVVLNEPPTYPLNLWIPNAVGALLTWRGTSTAYLDEPDVLFSTLFTGAGASGANFDVAHRVTCGGPLGACCRTDGSCILLTSTGCTNETGVYRGNGSVCAGANCTQPPTGACCSDAGCTITTLALCSGASGVYQGNGAACAGAGCAPATAYREQDDVGELPSTAALVNNGTGPLLTIHGSLYRFTDADMFKIRICDPANFSAGMTGLNFGAELFLFRADGTGIATRMQYNGPATITNQFTSSLPAGEYYLAAAAFLKMPQDNASQYLWITDHFDNVERAPDGPGAANPIDHWDSGGGVDGVYNIALTGACFLGGTPPAPCYANCDHSTVLPCLNVQDFTCFLNKFSSADTYANCDNSTIAPVLNVQDFTCFLNRFSSGCSNC